MKGKGKEEKRQVWLKVQQKEKEKKGNVNRQTKAIQALGNLGQRKVLPQHQPNLGSVGRQKWRWNDRGERNKAEERQTEDREGKQRQRQRQKRADKSRV